jgi:hypothetical protein
VQVDAGCHHVTRLRTGLEQLWEHEGPPKGRVTCACTTGQRNMRLAV